jgi:hypothetical protein
MFAPAPSTPTIFHPSSAPRLAHTHPALDAELTHRFIRAALAAFPDLRVADVNVEGGRMVVRVQVRATGHISEWAFPLRAV